MYAIIDIETTGGSALTEKITEIAIYKHDGTAVVDEYQTLVNPEKPIPPFITRLTGISDEMVSRAPKFYEVARKIVEFTEGCTFVAHNSAFDYQFVRQEFLRLGYRYKRPNLCTVKLSRKLIPGLPSYSLGNLCQSLNITIKDRHRAAGDALATVKLFEKLLSVDENLCGISTDGLHPDLDRGVFVNLPSAAGVYYFYSEKGVPIYVGKSKDIASRVHTHFSSSKTDKALQMRESVAKIGYCETGSELVALLKESAEIKNLKPVYNRLQRRTLYRYGLYLFENQAGYHCLQVSKLNKSSKPITVYTSYEEASAQIRRLAGMNRLCQKLCGIYHNHGACFHYGINMCNGACIGEEAPENYNIRVKQALSVYAHAGENMIIIDKGRNEDEHSAVLIEKGIYKGFGWYNPAETGDEPENIKKYIEPQSDNRDVLQIINSYLNHARGIKILTF